LPHDADLHVDAPGVLVARIQAVGLNFRDVLNVLGMYPGDPGDPGADCSGFVSSSAFGVASGAHRIGSAIFGLAPGCLGTHVQTLDEVMFAKPPSLSYTEAATCPTVFVTVEAALVSAARARPGSSVLIHAASGGVGLAGSHVIRSLGCSLVGTAGGAPKREVLRASGCRFALDSRSVRFVDEVVGLTSGVDSVLNSLTSTGMIAATLAGMRSGASFVEIGKRDIWSAGRVAMERSDVSFGYLALDFMRPREVSRGMRWLTLALLDGVVEPLRQVAFTMTDAQRAMRFMSQARHVAKVVVRPGSGSIASAVSGGKVLLTGGLGTLGSLISSWVVQESGRRLV
ncbi:MAG: zinc-binding dehydrogenase, partial [Planctomycetota bacterium]|nr:zinc-binding dehydrogenase [Planctomycetota bacterium]